MKKSELRDFFLAKQKSLSTDERRAKSVQTVERLLENFDFSVSRFVSCFVTIEKNGEFDTSQIFQHFWLRFPQIVVCAPRVDFEANSLENVLCVAETGFVVNKWQIREPASNEIIEPEKLDAVLVPLLAFDRRGFRVGYGKGFYDKFLKTCRADCLKIGLSLFPPVEKIEDAANFDVPLDWCATPEAIFRFDQIL